MKKFMLIFFLWLLLIVCGFIAYYSLRPTATLSEAEKKQAMERMLGRAVRNPTTGVATNHQYQGNTIAFSYPSTAEVLHNQYNGTNPTEREEMQFQERGTHLLFTATVSTGQDVTNFSDISGVTFREQASNGYTKSQGMIAHQPALLFSKSGDAFEKTGFVLANNHVYTFAATGIEQDAVNEAFSLVTKTAVLR